MFTEPTTPQGDIFADFMRQLPTELLVMVCGAGLLLTAIVIWIGWIKPRRRHRIEGRQAGASPAAAITQPAPDDLPDLDSLLSAADDAPAIRPSTAGGRVRLATGEETDTEEVLAVLRDRRSGRLLVYIDGIAYPTLTDAPAVKAEFVRTMRALNDVVGGTATGNLTKSSGVQGAPPAPAAPPHTEQPPAPSVPPVVDKSMPMPGDLPSFKLEDSITPQKGGLFKRTRYEANPVPELDIAAAIEAFLQHKLATTGRFPGRRIHVHSAESGGVRIQVGDAYYESVDQVTDAEVRTFLAATIQEWQDRQ